jgi:hypothetical protein
MSGATVHLTLTDDNTLKSGSGKAGLQAPAGAALEITAASDGSLTATGGGDGAGIGGGAGGGTGGSITISGGHVTAKGGNYGAGIGGSSNTGNGVMTLTGGTVSANSVYGAGIGGGYGGAGGTITITGGSVTATSAYGAGVGGGQTKAGGSITITGGNVTGNSHNAAGIGGGSSSATIGTVIITGGSIKTSGAAGPQPTNGHANVYLNTLTVGSAVNANTAITAGYINGVACVDGEPDASAGEYGIHDVFTDSDGKVYFYLPKNSSGEEPVQLTANSTAYGNFYTRETGHTTSATLTTLPQYAIAPDETGTHTFTPATYGYGAQTPLTVTVANTGYAPTGDLTITVTPADFTVTTSPLASIAAYGGTGSFTVQPQAGLSAGTHPATVTVSNAKVSSQTFTVTFTVNKKDVTITGLSADSKTYDGHTAATVTGTAVVTGKVSNDDVSVSAGSATFDNKNVGTNIPVTFSGYTLQGEDAGNYALTAQPGTVTANITALGVTITGLSADSNTYDGATAATVTGTAVVTGKIGNDDVSVDVSAGSATFNDKQVGNGKPVTFSGYALQGTDAGNYALTAQPGSVTADITAAEVAVQWGETSFVYDGQAHVPAATATGVGDDGDLPLTIDGAQTDAGTAYTAAASLTTPNANYTLANTTQTFDITPSLQTITFNPATPLTVEEDSPYTLVATTEDRVTVAFRTDGSTAAATLDNVNNTLLHLIQSGSVTVTAYINNPNYSAGEVSRTIGIVSINAAEDNIRIGNTTLTAPDFYVADCGVNDVDIVITPEEAGAKVLYEGEEVERIPFNISRPDIYTVNYEIQASAGNKTAYSIRIEKRFDFDAIGGTKFNNVLFINNNPATNGGYSFVSYEWFKNNALIGTGQYYSAGGSRSDLLDGLASYTAAMTTGDGKVLHTCPTEVLLRTSTSLLAYPNPVRSGNALNLEYSAPSVTGNPAVRIYNMQGELVNVQKLAGGKTTIYLPLPAGLYLITVDNEMVKLLVTD